MKPVKIRDLEIGSGIPKICVPITGTTEEEIQKAAEAAVGSPADVVEWRADWYEDIFDIGKTEETLKKVRDILGEAPLLFTFRTAQEGGEKSIAPDEYVKLNQRASRTGLIDLVDAEMSAGDSEVKSIINTAREYGVKVIVSYHDFHKTPEKDEIVSRLCRMQELGADILKIAVMPQSRKDVLALLEATEEMTAEHADRPVITMSMSGQGVISRLCGEVFGSALTFGTAGKASAPGQMEAEELRTMLKLLHKNM